MGRFLCADGGDLGDAGAYRAGRRVVVVQQPAQLFARHRVLRRGIHLSSRALPPPSSYLAVGNDPPVAQLQDCHAVSHRGMSSSPLLHGFEAASTIGWCRGERVTAAGFCAAALDLAARLPRKRYVLNLCEDRLNFMLGLAGALIAGQTSLLPPSRAAGVVREIFASYPDVCCLADHNELPAGLP